MGQKFLGFIMIFIMAFCGFFFLGVEGPGLAESVLRLHVIANSDQPGDQKLKLAVRDEVIRYMKSECNDMENAQQAENIARQQIPQIQALAEETIRNNGYDYPVEVVVGSCSFPEKTYGDLRFPAGEYEAVRVIIGEGEGQNWWCVLFPPLCLMSSSDEGLSLKSPEKAEVTLKCLELLPKGAKIGSKKESGKKEKRRMKIDADDADWTDLRGFKSKWREVKSET